MNASDGRFYIFQALFLTSRVSVEASHNEILAQFSTLRKILTFTPKSSRRLKELYCNLKYYNMQHKNPIGDTHLIFIDYQFKDNWQKDRIGGTFQDIINLENISKMLGLYPIIYTNTGLDDKIELLESCKDFKLLNSLTGCKPFVLVFFFLFAKEHFFMHYW